jgi:uncharacterized protein (DUF39 family)
MAKSIQEINERIKQRKAVILTAEEIIPYVEENGCAKTARQVDVVTTGTFGPMCSSGAFLNFGHTAPRMKMQKVWLNKVPAYGGIAACDAYLGATEIPEDDLANKIHPGKFPYGGGHVIEDLVAGKDLVLEATSYGTDCYPRRELHTLINIRDLNQVTMVNPRNAYQNYNVAVNTSKKVIYTYLGVLQPNMGTANYSCAGQLSPLMNDPYLRTIGVGTRIFLGGGVGYVAWEGTQHNPSVTRSERGLPMDGACTLTLLGNMKEMSPRYVRGVSLLGYGVSLALGVGIPIPILDEEMAMRVSVKDSDIFAPVVDYSRSYPQREGDSLGRVSYGELRSGRITFSGKEIPTSSLSSYPIAREIAGALKTWIQAGRFLLTEKVQSLPGPESGQTFRPLTIRQKGGKQR